MNRTLTRATETYPLLVSFLAVTLGSIALSLSAQWQVPLPFSPVPLTAQSLVVLSLGITLGPKLGALAVGFYLLQGVVGIPVFAGSVSGLAHLLGPTGGYLLGFIPAAAASGWIATRFQNGSLGKLALSFSILGAHTAIFLFGVTWLSFFVGAESALALGYLPFIPGEIIKSLIAAGLVVCTRSSVG